MTIRCFSSLIWFGVATAACSVQVDDAEGTEDVGSESDAIHRGLAVGDPASDDPEDLEAAVQVSYFGRWNGTGNQRKDVHPPLNVLCTGVVLAKDALVTAGHCIYGQKDDGSRNVFGLKAGESAWFWLDVKARQNGGATTWHDGWYLASMHPDFVKKGTKPTEEDNDIVILVAQNKALLAGIDEAEIWTDSIYTGMRLDMYGWGPNSDSGSGLGVLRKGHDNSELRVDAFDSRSLRGSSTDARGCSGDSGGPLLRWLIPFEPVIGISSNSNHDNQCTTKNDNRQHYTRLAPKLGWIEEKLGRACLRPWDETQLVRCEPSSPVR